MTTSDEEDKYRSISVLKDETLEAIGLTRWERTRGIQVCYPPASAEMAELVNESYHQQLEELADLFFRNRNLALLHSNLLRLQLDAVLERPAYLTKLLSLDTVTAWGAVSGSAGVNYRAVISNCTGLERTAWPVLLRLYAFAAERRMLHSFVRTIAGRAIGPKVVREVVAQFPYLIQ